MIEKTIAAGNAIKKLEIISGGVTKPANKKMPVIPYNKMLTDLRCWGATILIIIVPIIAITIKMRITYSSTVPSLIS